MSDVEEIKDNCEVQTTADTCEAVVTAALPADTSVPDVPIPMTEPEPVTSKQVTLDEKQQIEVPLPVKSENDSNLAITNKPMKEEKVVPKDAEPSVPTDDKGALTVGKMQPVLVQKDETDIKMKEESLSSEKGKNHVYCIM